jgi:hypothetical protein
MASRRKPQSGSAEQYRAFMRGDESAVTLKAVEYFGLKRDLLNKECIGMPQGSRDRAGYDRSWRDFFDWCLQSELFYEKVKINNEEFTFRVSGLQALIRNSRRRWKKLHDLPSGTPGPTEGSFPALLLEARVQVFRAIKGRLRSVHGEGSHF